MLQAREMQAPEKRSPNIQLLQFGRFASLQCLDGDVYTPLHRIAAFSLKSFLTLERSEVLVDLTKVLCASKVSAFPEGGI